MKRTLVLLCSMVAIAQPSLADSLKDGIAAFNRSDFGTAITTLSERVRVAPHDAVAHYYLANAFVRTGQTSRAISEYAFCMQLNTNAQITEYARQALNTLRPSANLSSIDLAPPPTLLRRQRDERVEELTDEYMKTNAAYLARKKQELENAKQRINDRADQDVRDVPTMGLVGRGNMIQGVNPEYHDELDRIRKDADRRIAQLESDYQKEEDRLREAARKKAEAELTASERRQR